MNTRKAGEMINPGGGLMSASTESAPATPVSLLFFCAGCSAPPR